MSVANVELVRRGYGAMLDGDLDALAELLAPDVKWHGGDPGGPAACRNRAEALSFMRRARARGPIGELVEIIDAGDQVVVILRPRAGGDEGAGLVANLTTIRDGKVIEMVHYPDPAAALRAAGVAARPA